MSIPTSHAAHDHHAGHDHHHHHDHHHGAPRLDRAFALGTSLNLGFVAVEIVYGLIAHSMALLADAGHNFADVLGLLLAWGAAHLAGRKPSFRRTYGLRRGSILAALINAAVLLVSIGAIGLAAIERFGDPQPIATDTVLVVALLGAVINGGTALLFARGSHGDLNRRAAFLHMAADAGLSLGVAATAFAVGLTGFVWLDPLASLAIVLIIAAGAWRLLRQSLDLALDAVPEGIDRAAIEAYLEALPGVTEIHDLHIWGMSTTETALTVHLVRPHAPLDDAMLAVACRDLAEQFGVAHATLQVESGDRANPCGLASADVL
jgi:cobalt-zinc-cadmium efflux system protein